MALQIVEAERRVQVPFTATLDDGRTYTDALTMTAAEWTASTVTSRKALMRDRVTAWLDALNAMATAGDDETDQERRQRLRLQRAEALRAAAAAEEELAETEPEEPEA